MFSLNWSSKQILKNKNTDLKEEFKKEIKIKQELNKEEKKRIIKLLKKY